MKVLRRLNQQLSRARHVSSERIGQEDGQFFIYRSSALSWDGSMKQFEVCMRLL
jgi:hypothetical protein